MTRTAIVKKKTSKTGKEYFKVNIFDGSRYIFNSTEQVETFVKGKLGTDARIVYKETKL